MLSWRLRSKFSLDGFFEPKVRDQDLERMLQVFVCMRQAVFEDEDGSYVICDNIK